MKELLDVSKSFWEQDRRIYHMKNGSVGGYYQQEGKFTLMSVPKAGHFIPYFFYDSNKEVLDDMIVNGSLTCRDCRVNELMCQAMKTDESRGVCKNNGKLFCDTGYTGADCSHFVMT